MSRFDYVKYDDKAQEHQAMFKATYEALEQLIGILKPGRHQSLALTCLEESFMWVGKAIRDEQIERNGPAEIQP